MTGKSTASNCRRSRRTLAVLFALAVSTSLACSGLNSQFDGPKYKSDLFVYRTEDGDPNVCEEVALHVDAHARSVGRLLDIALSGRGKYYKFRSSDSFREADVCRSSAQGCYGDDAIYSIKPIDGHELSHWVMGQRFGTDVPLLFAEGIANAVSCEPHFLPESDDWNFRDFGVDPPITDSFNHVQAGRLMLGVWALTGDPTVWTDLLSLPRGATNEELAEGAVRMGIDLDAAWEVAVQGRLPACVPVYACTGPELDWGTTKLRAGCHGFDPMTLAGGEGGLRFYSSDLDVRLLPCHPGADPMNLHSSPLREPAGDYEFWLPSPPEKAAVWLEGAESDTHERSTELRVEPLPGAFHVTCQEPASELRENQNVALIIVGEPVHFVPLSMERPGPLNLRWDGPIPPEVTVSWCLDCDGGAATECEELPALAMGGRHLFDEVQAGVLRIETNGTLPAPVRLELLPN